MGRTKEGPAENGCLERKRSAWPLLVGLALVTLFVAVSCGGAAREQRAEDPGPQASAEKPQAGADLEHPSLGDENAPVVMIEYGDFQ